MFRRRVVFCLMAAVCLLLSACRPPTDLVVRSINVNSILVTCPAGQGSCINTATFTIANTGTAAAGPFNVEVIFDANPAVNLPVAGLAAGASQTLTATTGPGNNCFDPDCTVCVTVDSGNAVAESDETNNKKCETKLG